MSAFGRSILASGASVGGLRLRRFSAFHALALLAVDSPYITRRKEPHAGDTTFALVVCMLSRADGIHKASRAVGSLRWRWYWLWHNHDNIAHMLFEHISSSLEFPAVWQDDNRQTKATGAPWPFYLVSTIAQNVPSIPYAEIWDMPIAELICHKAILSEDAGALQIAENDLDLIRRKREARKQVA